MNKKIFENARFTPKGDIEANWRKATGFVPLDKEIIIYKPDETHACARMKVGNGKSGVNDLPFVNDITEIATAIAGLKSELLVEIGKNTVALEDVNGQINTINGALTVLFRSYASLDQTYATDADVDTKTADLQAQIDTLNATLADYTNVAEEGA